mgnify:CR=1 FL=1
MKQTYTREKKTLCGEGYMEVDSTPSRPRSMRPSGGRKQSPAASGRRSGTPSTHTGEGYRKPTQTLPCWDFI